MKTTTSKVAYSLLFLVPLFAVIMGCISFPPVHRSLDPEMAQQDIAVNIVSHVPADEIVAHFEAGTYTSSGGGGLLWLMIDAGINKSRAGSAEERIEPLLEASADIDFRAQYWGALEETLGKAGWLKTKSIVKSAESIEKDAMFDASLPLLTMSTVYELSPNAQVLRVQTWIRMYLKDGAEPDYFGATIYISEKIGKNNEDNEEAIALWAMNGADALREALGEGIAQNMEMLKYDLLDGPNSLAAESKEEISIKIRDPISGSMVKYKGVLVKEIENRMLIREQGGNLFSIPRSILE